MQETTQAKEKMGLNKDKLTILSVGGSLGSRTLNNGWKENLKNLKKKAIN
jgi:UDP-N-acetylglucosamine--N-acetylmuramyl-(pentapeptide) pyrophosphoryl-undecaprenol N-acetylglucosamine transferase